MFSLQILYHGVMSNAVSFTVNSLSLTSVSPNSAGGGISVTFTGTGFGTSQGTGAAILGTTAPAQILSWSETQIVATVAASALSGVAHIQQNGAWSNALSFTVPPPGGGTGNTLVPVMLNMVVGDTHTIQALNPSSHPVTGLTWTSSDPAIRRC